VESERHLRNGSLLSRRLTGLACGVGTSDYWWDGCGLTSLNFRENLKGIFKFQRRDLLLEDSAFVMAWFQQFVAVFTFLFFLTSPLTSYGDQIFAMHRRKSSAGFSIDVCGIMLVARYVPSLPDNPSSCGGELSNLWGCADLLVY